MTYVRDIATLLAASALYGCSPVVDTKNSPDAPIDSADVSPPTITVSNPPAMSRRALVVQPISVFFDEPLDPASVSTTTVRLGADYNVFTPFLATANPDLFLPGGPTGAPLTNVRGTVTYDAVSHSITFKPAQALDYGRDYTLSITVKDALGNTLDTKLTFTTFLNAPSREVHFASNGPVTRYFVQPPDEAGYPDKRVRRIPGQDGTWFTSDDPAADHFAVSFDAMGKLTDESIMGVGSDQLLDSPDDTISALFRHAYDAEGRLFERARYSGSMPMDTMLVQRLHYEYTDDRLTGYVVYIAPGANTTWRNEDDLCSSFWEYTYDEAGRKSREIQRSCAADQRPRTSDDTIMQVIDYAYDANGEHIESALRTALDETSYQNITKLMRDEDGRVTQTFIYTGAGTNGTWRNEDDVIGRASRNVYDPVTKLLVQSINYTGDGGDAMWGNDNDTVGSYTTFTYDSRGNRIDRKEYIIGSDAKPFTPDDAVTQDFDFSSDL